MISVLMAGAALLMTATPLAGQAGVASDPVIVTARPVPQRALVDRWVRALSVRSSSDEPLSRLSEPLCVVTAGLRVELGIALADRVLANAEHLKIRLAGPRCRPNVLIVFVDNGARQVDWLNKYRPAIFGDLPYSTIRALKTDKGPVHAWHITAIASRDGEKLVAGDGGFPTLHIPTASRIDAPIQSQIVAAVVMIDRSALPGKRIEQIADYATFRALARVNPSRQEGKPEDAGTILSLFDEGTSPDHLTALDWGYLRGLYSGRATRRASAQYADMARSVMTEMALGEAPR
ncbi:hypothetical protein RN629_08945 [Sphingomonadaceae bacterium jetA1]|uniref:hypothetical protein n=1 Tax=Facivitalis istanbulensis TaxID=3075838 RepID=UPI003479A34F